MKETEILLDVARCPLAKYEIEQGYWRKCNPQRFSYLILHLNDDEHVTFQSKILGNVGAPNTLSVRRIYKPLQLTRGSITLF